MCRLVACIDALCFFSSRRRQTSCVLVTGVQTCALPIFSGFFTWRSRRVASAETWQRSTRGLGEQEIDETLGRRLRLMVGEAGTLVGLDDHIIRAVEFGNQQVEPHDRNFNGPRGADGGVAERGVHAVGDRKSPRLTSSHYCAPR